MLCLGWVGVEGWRRARHAYRHVWDGQQPCIDRTPFYLRPTPPLYIPSLMCSQTALSNKLTVVNTIRIYTISMKTIKINRFKSSFNVENALTPRPHFISKNRPNLRSLVQVMYFYGWNPTTNHTICKDPIMYFISWFFK